MSKLYVVDEILGAYPDEFGAYLSLWGILIRAVTIRVVGRYLGSVLVGPVKFKEPRGKRYKRIIGLVLVRGSFLFFLFF